MLCVNVVAQPEQITALLPAQQGDKTPDNAITFALSSLLHFMVSEVCARL